MLSNITNNYHLFLLFNEYILVLYALSNTIYWYFKTKTSVVSKKLFCDSFKSFVATVTGFKVTKSAQEYLAAPMFSAWITIDL